MDVSLVNISLAFELYRCKAFGRRLLVLSEILGGGYAIEVSTRTPSPTSSSSPPSPISPRRRWLTSLPSGLRFVLAAPQIRVEAKLGMTCERRPMRMKINPL